MLRRPVPVAAVGIVIVAVLVGLGVQLNPNESQLKNFPGTGTAIAGRQMLADANISPGVMKPFDVLVENGGNANAVAAKVSKVDGVTGAAVPAGWQRGSNSLVEAFPATDGAAPGIQGIVDRVNASLKGTDGTLGGVAAIDRDFVHAIYGNFPYVLAFVLILTLILLARAFRSIVLPIKAAILNLVSLGAAFGIVVFIFQKGHGSSLWNITATQAITAWIPLMIFAFLFGLSMDYEVFMLTRMREAYDETGSTNQAIELGLARTGKLVTSAALILMFAFLVLSSSPGFEIKEFAIGLAAGIIFDATVIRALLVPSLMRLLGPANWWMPNWARTALFLPSQEDERAPGRSQQRTRSGTPLIAARLCRIRGARSWTLQSRAAMMARVPLDRSERRRLDSSRRRRRRALVRWALGAVGLAAAALGAIAAIGAIGGNGQQAVHTTTHRRAAARARRSTRPGRSPATS